MLIKESFLIRAIHEWCCETNTTPYLVVYVNEKTIVPKEYIKDNLIVLDISYEATQDLILGNNLISFKAKFNGLINEIKIPVKNVMSIFAAETKDGIVLRNEPPKNEPDPIKKDSLEKKSTKFRVIK